MPFGSISAPFWEAKVVRGRNGKSPKWGFGVSGVPVWVVWVSFGSLYGQKVLFSQFLTHLATFLYKKTQFLQVVLWNDQPSNKKKKTFHAFFVVSWPGCALPAAAEWAKPTECAAAEP